MRKALGYILSISGLIVLAYSIIQYFEETETFSIFGADVVISQGNLVPIIISLIITVLGLLLLFKSRK